MRSPSQATPARRDRAPHYFRGERLLGGSRPAGEIENGVGGLSHCAPQEGRRAWHSHPRPARDCPHEQHVPIRGGSAKHIGQAAPAMLEMRSVRHGGRDVLRGASSTRHTSPTPGEPFWRGPNSNSSRIVPTPPGPAGITTRELFSDSPTPLSSRVRPTGEALPRCCAQASLPEPRLVKRSWPSD
jgi:hypothetical protein